MSENETDSEEWLFVSKNSFLFKKYKLIKKLCSGAFGNIYLGYYIRNNSYVAIKTEPRKTPNQHLETEAYFLYSLKGIGIPEILSYGRTKYYNVLVEPLLGKSLYHLYLDNNRHFEIKDICLIGIQIIDRLEWIHSKNVIHRDIKPDNFLIGENDPNLLYLIDFGLSTKYRSSASGKHVKFGFTGKLTGTTKYSSANTIRGGEQSRKDDLESVAYMIIFFMKGDLPWEHIKSNNEINKYYKIYMMKKNLPVQQLCKGLPIQIYNFLKYVKGLTFEEQPDYNYLRSLFKALLYKYKYIYNNKMTFSWVDKNCIFNNGSINLYKRKSNFHSRLFKYIQKQLEIKESINGSNIKTLNPKSVRNKYLINSTSRNNAKYKNKNKKVESKNRANNKLYLIKSDSNSAMNNDIKLSLKTPLKNFGNFSEYNYTISDITNNIPNLKQMEIKKNKSNNKNNQKNKLITSKKFSPVKENNQKKRNLTNGTIKKINNKNINNKNNIININNNNINNLNNINNIKNNNQSNKIINNNLISFKKNNYNSFNNQSYYFLSNNKNYLNTNIQNTNKNIEKTKKIKNVKKPNISAKNRAPKYSINYPINQNNSLNNFNINKSSNKKYITKIVNNNYNYYSIVPIQKNNSNKNNINTNNSNFKSDIKFNNSFYVNTISDFNVELEYANYIF